MKQRKPAHKKCVVAASVALDLDLRLAGDDPLTVQMVDRGGKSIPRLSIAAYSGVAIRQWWSADPVVVNLAGMKLPAKHSRLVLLRDHNMSRPIGNATVIKKTDTALSLDGECTVPGVDTDQFVESSKNGFPWRGSIGCSKLVVAYVQAGEKLEANGRTFDGPLSHVVSCDLGEVSVCTMGADDETESVAATDEERDQIMKRIRATAAPAPAAPGTPPPAVVAGASEPGAPAPATAPAPTVQASATPPGTPIDFTAQRNAQAAEETRVGAIRAIAGIATDISAQAIREGWTVERAELHVLRANRPQAPNVLIPNQPERNGEVLEAAFCQTIGVRAMDKHFTPQVIEAAGKRFRNLGLQELLLTCAMQNGYIGRQSVHQGNLREVLRAAFSTTNFGTMLTSAGNKLLWEGFNSISQSWRAVAGTRNVSDFKAVTAWRLTTSLEYEEVAPTGTIAHGTLASESYSMQAKTYAKMAVLTRQDIINDDLGAFNDLRQRLGIGAVGKMNKVFWTAWLAARNAGTFWTAARGNLVTGAALAEAGMNKAVQAFRDMKGPDGFRIGLTPKYVLIPSILESTAKKLYVSTEVRDTTANTKALTANIYTGMYEPITVPELGDSAYTGYSPTGWHLLADPKVLASAVMCFLNGAETPTVESADADFDMLGIQFRGYHDFGVAMSEYLASVEAQA